MGYDGFFVFQDIMPLVEDLNNAGIRFVHFSSENELRSRVSVEKITFGF